MRSVRSQFLGDATPLISLEHQEIELVAIGISRRWRRKLSTCGLQLKMGAGVVIGTIHSKEGMLTNLLDTVDEDS